MAKLISLSIDVTKISKDRLIQGKKGTYLNLTVSVSDDKDQYDNDVACWESQDKEERERDTPRTFLGNGRVIWSGESKARPVVKQAVQTDLPF